MRYRIGDTPAEPGPMVDQGAFIGIAALSLAIGIGFVFVGIRSRHYWLSVWGTGLTVASIACLGVVIRLIWI